MLAIYCRTSKRKDEGKDVSIPTQKREGIKFAKESNQQYKIFVDEGISGTKEEIKDRPSFAEMFDAIKNEEINAVYCYDQSRIERNNTIWGLFVHIMLETKSDYYPAGKHFDLNDAQNRFYSGIISLTNELYATLTSQKVKLAIAINAEKGKTHGITAYGYERDKDGYFVIKENEAKIVERIFNLSLQGTGAYTIANILNEENIPTKFNSYSGEIKMKDDYTKKITRFKKSDVRWRGNVIHDMIRNPIYKGERKWNDLIIKIPEIIEEKLWDKVNKNLEKNKKKAGKKEEYKYLLNGIVYCAECGNEFRGKKRLKGHDTAYKCKSRFSQSLKCTTSRGLSIAKFETFIIHHLFFNRDLIKYLNSLPVDTEEIDSLKIKLNMLEAQLIKLDKKITHGYKLILDPDFENDEVIKDDLQQSKRKKLNLEESIDVIKKKISLQEVLSKKSRLKNTIGQYTLASNFETTKKLIHSLIEKITIKHQKVLKGGFFFLEVKYQGYSESSIFLTNWQALKWYWTRRYRAKAITKADLEADTELLEYLLESKGSKAKVPADFAGFETVESAHEIIELNPSELITFD